MQVVAGANIATILVMLFVGYSDRFNPVDHTLLSTIGLTFPVFLCINIAFTAFWIIFSVRRVIIPLVGFIVCYAPVRVYAPLNINKALPDSTIKVLSYNVWTFKDWTDVSEPCRILDYLIEQNADIVCLQESGTIKVKRDIINKRMATLYAYSDTVKPSGSTDEITVFSKFPIVGKENINYESKNNHSAAFRLDVHGDTVIFMNFRPDRARQMTRIFCDDDFKGFERRGGRKQVNYVCMAEYDATMPNCEVAYPPVELKNVLGQYLSENGKTQLRIAETEKYAHVTFFFNGGVEAPYEGEDRKVIPSPKDVPTYDLKPQMSAPEVADECKARIESGKYDVIILNFANCDMVGHTGVFDSAVKAVEAVDAAVNEVVTAVLNAGGCVFLTADHGNAEKMKNPDGTPFTAHTTNPVPFVAIGCGDVKLREGGCLADIAPTMLPYIGLPVPSEMTGKSLIVD